MGATLFVAHVFHRRQRLHVDLGIALAVETASHEVGAAVLLIQAAIAHHDAGGLGHQRICVLNAPVVLPGPQLEILTRPVELQQPVLEARIHVELPRTDLAGGGVPGDHGLRARAAGGGANAHDVGERGGSVLGVVEIAVERAPRLLDQALHLEWRGGFGVGAARRPELQRTHAALAYVGQSVELGHLVLVDASLCHPRVDQLVAEVVGQSVGDESWQAVEGHGVDAGEDEGGLPVGGRHHPRRQFNPALAPRFGVLERVGAALRVARDRANEMTPDVDLDQADRLHQPPRRCWRSWSMGLIVGPATRLSRPSVASSAFSTLTKVASVDPVPCSRLRRDRGEMPARSATSCWVIWRLRRSSRRRWPRVAWISSGVWNAMVAMGRNLPICGKCTAISE